MKYDEFVNAVTRQDARNKFERSKGAMPHMPKGLKEFYSQYNPCDVEIVLADMTSIKMYSQAKLLSFQVEYGADDDQFVFATREGDPIAINDNKIITSAHGSKKTRVEVVSESFDEFVCWILKEMKRA